MHRLLPLTTLLLLFANQSIADPHRGIFEYDNLGDVTVEEVMEQTRMPEGVVFEVYSSSDDTLAWAFPIIRDHIAEIRDKFPDIAIVVISHGLEEFSLMKQYAKDYPKIHSLGRKLASDDKVSLMVDAEYATTLSVKADEFVDFVNPVANGPDEVMAYKKKGYMNVVIRPLEDAMLGANCPANPGI